jgi:hypothetical protein
MNPAAKEPEARAERQGKPLVTFGAFAKVTRRKGGTLSGRYRSNGSTPKLTKFPNPCSPTQLVTGALHRVKRETGESCALLKAMSVRCCPRNGKRAKRRSTVPLRHGKVMLAGRPMPTPREPGDRPATHSAFCVAEHNKPAVGGRCSNLCVPDSQGFACALFTR